MAGRAGVHRGFTSRSDLRITCTMHVEVFDLNAIRPPTLKLCLMPYVSSLFRYCALTFNAHKVHYDRDVEGHPDLVIHGTLSAMLLVELTPSAGKESGK